MSHPLADCGEDVFWERLQPACKIDADVLFDLIEWTFKSHSKKRSSLNIYRLTVRSEICHLHVGVHSEITIFKHHCKSFACVHDNWIGADGTKVDPAPASLAVSDNGTAGAYRLRRYCLPSCHGPCNPGNTKPSLFSYSLPRLSQGKGFRSCVWNPGWELQKSIH